MSTYAAFLRTSDIATTKVHSRRGNGVHHGLLPISAATWFAWVDAGKAPPPAKLEAGEPWWTLEDVVGFIRAGAESDGDSPQPIPEHMAGAAWTYTAILQSLTERGIA